MSKELTKVAAIFCGMAALGIFFQTVSSCEKQRNVAATQGRVSTEIQIQWNSPAQAMPDTVISR